MASKEFKFGGKLWTAFYDEEYNLTELLDGDGQSNFYSTRAVERATDLIHTIMITEMKFRRRGKKFQEVSENDV